MKPAAPARLYPAALFNTGWRYLLLRRWQTALMIVGIALGVAVMVAIDLANASAGQAFQLSAESVTGKATHQIVGGPQGLDEQVYVDIVRQKLVDFAAPVIMETVSSPELGNLPMQLLGIDPFADAPFRNYLASGQVPRPDQLTPFFTRPGAVVLSSNMAARYHLSLGSSFLLVIEGRAKPVFVAGLLNPADSLARRTLEGVLLVDISTAQELTGRLGKLDRIDLILPQDSTAAIQTLKPRLPPGVEIQTVAARQGTIEKMTAAFSLNLTALSLLALVVGLFLIYNTMTFSVVQRRAQFGTLRCLGVTRREIFVLVVSEAFLVGVIGSAIGIGLGVLMGRSTVGLVTRTINDLYFTTNVQAVGISLESLLKGAAAGIIATVLTAAFPAWEAASVPPREALSRSALETKTRRAILLTAAIGIGLIAAGVMIFQVRGGGLFLGFGGTFAVIVGFAMFAAITMALMMRLAAPLLGKALGTIGRMAPRNLVGALSRTSVAVAALMVAVAVTIGVSLMIDSFRYTVTVWLEQTLQSDIYISVPGFNATASLGTIDPNVLPVVKSWPGVQRAGSLRTVTLDSPQGPVQVSATDNPDIGKERLYLEARLPTDKVWAAMLDGGILVSEPLANRLGLFDSNRTVSLSTPQGFKPFKVVGIYFDYANSEGSLFMAMAVYRSIWKDAGITAIGIRLLPGADSDQVSRALQDRLGRIQQLLIRPNQALRDEVMAVFDRTFAITAALRVLATMVAFIGVLSTLLLLQLEKQREVGILRALGLTGRQLWGLTMLETGLMGLSAGILAIPTGYALSLILIYVINRRSFGWTLQFAAPVDPFLQAILIAIISALLAGIYPAWRIEKKAAAEVIRNE
ncbi:MAG TPA: FtsX-like permease family protein [Anaerolineaceae bacterium]|nr:FtsX-like permease family protein [Anaerolineaceae bacterium]